MPCLEILMHPVMIDGWLMRLGGGEAGNASAVHQLIHYYIKYILLIFQKMLLREGFQKKFLWKVWYFAKPWVHWASGNVLKMNQFTFAQNLISGAVGPIHYITLKAFAMALGTKCKTCFGCPRMVLCGHWKTCSSSQK